MADAVEDCVLGEDVSTNYGLRIAALFAILTASFIGGVLPLITRHAKTGTILTILLARTTRCMSRTSTPLNAQLVDMHLK